MFSLESIQHFNDVLVSLLGTAFLIGILIVILVVFLTLAFGGAVVLYEFLFEDVFSRIQKKRLRRLKIDAEVIGRVQS